MASSGRINKENTNPALDHESLPGGQASAETVLLSGDSDRKFLYWAITKNCKKEVLRLHRADISRKGRRGGDQR